VKNWKYTSPVENQSEQYANFAIAFDMFCSTYWDSLISELDTLYDVGIDRYTYMIRMRTKLSESLMESSRFPLALNSGMSTFFLIINWIFSNNPNIRKEDVIMKILQWAWSLKREKLPPSNDTNITESYKSVVGQIMNNPGDFMKTADQKKGWLPCPIIFTKAWQEFLINIILLLYKRFPENQDPPLS